MRLREGLSQEGIQTWGSHNSLFLQSHIVDQQEAEIRKNHPFDYIIKNSGDIS